MSFEHMLANADPEDAAEAANIIARAVVNDPSASDAARAAAATVLELSTEELTQGCDERGRRRPQVMMRARRGPRRRKPNLRPSRGRWIAATRRPFRRPALCPHLSDNPLDLQ